MTELPTVVFKPYPTTPIWFGICGTLKNGRKHICLPYSKFLSGKYFYSKLIPICIANVCTHPFKKYVTALGILCWCFLFIWFSMHICPSIRQLVKSCSVTSSLCGQSCLVLELISMPELYTSSRNGQEIVHMEFIIVIENIYWEYILNNKFNLKINLPNDWFGEQKYFGLCTAYI